MAEPSTAQQPFSRHPTDDPPPRNKTVGGSFSAEEKEKVQEALESAGFENESKGVRAVMLAWVSSAEVRDAVARALRVA